ncbi:hypothetical protein BCR35DRAFT_307957 [Leucosporidium creatinivorum]|uniref:Chromo domain-containing protein n=1 Tax=Leucosporidium creatinivorum TaxID=106004 RepID=A0A1Y2EGD9_9BASI|nr:hypothetical protein BCR35DRAFT_307957 [Leucosporidium creatinivorum]
MARIKDYSKSSRRKSQPEPESEDEEEYEVEKVIDHKRKKSVISYYVSWVGYPGELTWIDEDSAAGCPDLVNAYWKKQPLGKQHERFPVGSKEEAAALKRAEAEGAGGSKKRRASKVTEDDDEGEQEEEEEAPKSRRKSGASTKSNGTSKAAKKESPVKKEKKEKKEPAAKKAKKELKQEEEVAEEEVEEVEEGDYDEAAGHTMSRHDLKYAGEEHDWEELVSKVDTVDSEPEDAGLRFLLIWTEDGTATYVPAADARKRCPQRIIDFFTEHLKFRQTDADEEEE